jgi:hypothetical protein
VKVFICLLVSLQQDQTAVRTEKGDYLQAVEKCRTAEAAIESDPRAAVEKLDEVLGNPRVRKVECRLRIEEKASEYTPWYLFLPYQYRGRARINLAKKSEPEAAVKLLAGAVEDLQESVRRGIASSDPHLKTAKAELEKAKAAAAAPKPGDPAEDPFPRIRRSVQALVDQQKYKSARAAVEKEGAALAPEQRKTLADEVDRACRDHVDGKVRDFRRQLGSDLGSLADFRALGERDLDATFRLPPAEELVVAEPVFDWARAYLPAFRRVRAGEPAESLLPAALASVPLAAEGENRFFLAVEKLAFESLRDQMKAASNRARDALRAVRDGEKKASADLQAKWRGFVEKLDPRFLERHPAVAAHTRDLDQAAADFPVELAEIDRVDLEGCFRSPDPAAALAQKVKELKEYREIASLARESRQKLYTLLVAAEALLQLAQGSDEDAAAQSLRAAYQDALRQAGGPGPEAAKFGPRVAKVVEALR